MHEMRSNTHDPTLRMHNTFSLSDVVSPREYSRRTNHVGDASLPVSKKGKRGKGAKMMFEMSQ